VRYLLYILFFIPAYLLSQSEADSVKKIIRSASADTTRIEAYNYLAIFFSQKELFLAKKYADSALAEIEKSEKNSPKDPAFYEKNKGMAYNTLGHIYHQQGNYNEAIQYCLKTIRIFEKYNDSRNLSKLYSSLGIILQSVGNWKDALSYFKKGNSIDAAAYNSNKADIDKKNDLIGSYINLSVAYYDQQIIDTSLYYSKKALSLADTTQLSEDLGLIYQNIAIAYAGMNNFKAAILYTERALENYKAADLTESMCIAYSNLAEMHLRSKDLKKAMECAQKGEEIGNAAGLIDNLAYLYETKAQIYEAMGDLKNTIFYLRKYAALKDSINTNSHLKQIEELKTQYETEKKEAEILKLNKDMEISALQLKEEAATRQRLIIIVVSVIAALLAFALLSLFLYQNIREKKKAYIKLQTQSEELNRQARLITKYQSQMNPHFVFNALNSIQGSVINDDKNKTIDRLQLLAQLMRQTLNNSENEFISLAEEIRYLKTYFNFEKEKFHHTIRFVIDQPGESENILIPPMMIQPFIENAVKHAGLDKISDPEIRLEILEENNFLKVMISDNGEGFDTSDSSVLKRSHAVSIIRSRLQLLFMTDKESDIQFSIRSKPELERGTEIKFYLPLNYKY
jgi:tetratricopeptide (TPR) repeat protein